MSKSSDSDSRSFSGEFGKTKTNRYIGKKYDTYEGLDIPSSDSSSAYSSRSSESYSYSNSYSASKSSSISESSSISQFEPEAELLEECGIVIKKYSIQVDVLDENLEKSEKKIRISKGRYRSLHRTLYSYGELYEKGASSRKIKGALNELVRKLDAICRSKGDRLHDDVKKDITLGTGWRKSYSDAYSDSRGYSDDDYSYSDSEKYVSSISSGSSSSSGRSYSSSSYSSS